MDSHFPEYVAVVQAMQEIYGEQPDGQPTEFHSEPKQAEKGEPRTLGHEYLGG